MPADLFLGDSIMSIETAVSIYAFVKVSFCSLADKSSLFEDFYDVAAFECAVNDPSLTL